MLVRPAEALLRSRVSEHHSNNTIVIAAITANNPLKYLYTG